MKNKILVELFCGLVTHTFHINTHIYIFMCIFVIKGEHQHFHPLSQSTLSSAKNASFSYSLCVCVWVLCVLRRV